MDYKLSSIEKEKLLLRELSKKGASTANEIIDTIFRRDVRKGYEHAVGRGWRFYVHLNKHFSVLSRNGYIQHKASKIGPSGRSEKIWIPTEKSLNKHFKKTERQKGIKMKIKLSLKKIRLKAQKG